MTGYILDNILRLAHPFMPFISEFLWSEERTDEQILMAQDWPQANASPSADDEEEMDWLIDIISAVRSARTQMRIPAGLVLAAQSPSAGNAGRFAAHAAALEHLARIKCRIGEAENPADSAHIIARGTDIYLALGGVIDLAAEKSRLTGALAAAEQDIAGFAARLANKEFARKAPAHIIDSLRARREEKALTASALREALTRFPNSP